MCGRYTLTTEVDKLTSFYQFQNSFVLKPRYNIAPAQYIPVVKRKGQLEFLTWGFMPNWMIQKPHLGFINARHESILEKAAFKQAYRQRRCLIWADGFYEWATIKERKQPFYFRRKDHSPFAFGGIWEGDTCAILTSESKGLIKKIHARMPVIIEKNQYEAWLDPKRQFEINTDVTKQIDQDWLMYPVSLYVNNPKQDNESCIEPLHAYN